VLNAGASEPPVETKELFERPRTLQAARITGCKNCVLAERIGENKVRVPAWNTELAFEGAASGTITHIGVRAHYVAPCGAGAENAVICRVVDAADDVFSRVLTLAPAGGRDIIRAELNRENAIAFAVGGSIWFQLPKEHVMPLTEAHEI
jgi:molybdate transport system ATP-binding protein